MSRISPSAGDLGGLHLAAGDRQHPLHRGGVGWIAVVQPAAHRPAGQRQPCGRQRACIGGVQPVRQLVQQIVVVAGEVGLAAQQRHRVAPRQVGQHRQQLVAHPVAQVARVVVGGIVHHRQVQGRAQRDGLGPAQRQQWPGRPRSHRTQPGQGCASQQVQQDGFRLVVGGVPGHHVGGKHRVARLAGTGLEVRAVGHRHPFGAELSTQVRGQRRHHTGLRGRAGAQAVIDVHRGDLQARGDGEHQESGGISATGDGAGDAATDRWERAARQ